MGVVFHRTAPFSDAGSCRLRSWQRCCNASAARWAEAALPMLAAAKALRLEKEEGLHVCPDKASWLMQGPQRERRAHTGNETGTKLKSKHKTTTKKP